MKLTNKQKGWLLITPLIITGIVAMLGLLLMLVMIILSIPLKTLIAGVLAFVIVVMAIIGFAYLNTGD